MNTFIPFDLPHRFVLACVLAPDAVDLAAHIRRVGADALAWDRLLAVATNHSVRPVVARCLENLQASERAESTALSDLAAAARANQGRAKLLAGDLISVLDGLATARIPAIPYKGPTFEHALGSAPGLREMTDLDIFVRAAHLVSATRALEPLGYEPALPTHALAYSHFDRVTPEWLLVRRADGLIIELHCRVAPAWFPAPCGLDDIEARQQSLTLAGHTLAWPAPEELLLVHIADGMKSCGCGMKWIGDIARILRRHPDIDWEHISAVAARHGGLNVVRVALALVIDLCAEIAQWLGAPSLGLIVPPQAAALAAEARSTLRLATALGQIRTAVQADAPLPGAMAHFRWSLRLSDRPASTVAAILRYLGGPAIIDLAEAPAGATGLPLAARALLRRVETVAGLRH